MPFSVHNSAITRCRCTRSKRANELMAHILALFRTATTGLRFFSRSTTVGAPGHGAVLFSANILEGKPIDVFTTVPPARLHLRR